MLLPWLHLGLLYDPGGGGTCILGWIDKFWKGHGGQIKKNTCKNAYCKIGKKGYVLVILTNFGKDMADKLRKTHAKIRIYRVYFHIWKNTYLGCVLRMISSLTYKCPPYLLLSNFYNGILRSFNRWLCIMVIHFTWSNQLK